MGELLYLRFSGGADQQRSLWGARSSPLYKNGPMPSSTRAPNRNFSHQCSRTQGTSPSKNALSALQTFCESFDRANLQIVAHFGPKAAKFQEPTNLFDSAPPVSTGPSGQMRRQGRSLGQLISLMQHLGHPEQDAAQTAATEQVPQRPDEDHHQGGWDGSFLRASSSEHCLCS